jgi:hypothetical protein
VCRGAKASLVPADTVQPDENMGKFAKLHISLSRGEKNWIIGLLALTSLDPAYVHPSI